MTLGDVYLYILYIALGFCGGRLFSSWRDEPRLDELERRVRDLRRLIEKNQKQEP